MKTFCHRCGENTENSLYAEIRECSVCGAMWEDHEKPEMTALRAENEALKVQLTEFEEKYDVLLSRYNNALDTMRQYMEEGDDYE
jgi:hypothetical protein